MQTTTGYSGGILPPGEEWEWRGTQAFHPPTGSSISATISYCKDIRGCGTKDYRSVSAAMTINYLDECVPRLNGVVSLSGLFFGGATETQARDLLEALLSGTIGDDDVVPDEYDFLENTAVACPVT